MAWGTVAATDMRWCGGAATAVGRRGRYAAVLLAMMPGLDARVLQGGSVELQIWRTVGQHGPAAVAFLEVDVSGGGLVVCAWSELTR